MQGKKSNCKYLQCRYCVLKDGASQMGPFSPQIGNVKPETEIIWSKDRIEIAEDDEDAKKIERQDGELTFNIGKVSPLDRGWTL